MLPNQALGPVEYQSVMDISCIHGIDTDPDCTKCKGAGYIEPKVTQNVAVEVEPLTGRITVSFYLLRCECTSIIGVGL